MKGINILTHGGEPGIIFGVLVPDDVDLHSIGFISCVIVEPRPEGRAHQALISTTQIIKIWPLKGVIAHPAESPSERYHCHGDQVQLSLEEDRLVATLVEREKRDGVVRQVNKDGMLEIVLDEWDIFQAAARPERFGPDRPSSVRSFVPSDAQEIRDSYGDRFKKFWRDPERFEALKKARDELIEACLAFAALEQPAAVEIEKLIKRIDAFKEVKGR